MATQNLPNPMLSTIAGGQSANMLQRWSDDAQQYSPYGQWPAFSGADGDHVGDNPQDEDCNYEQAAVTDERLMNPLPTPTMVWLYSFSRPLITDV